MHAASRIISLFEMLLADVGNSGNGSVWVRNGSIWFDEGLQSSISCTNDFEKDDLIENQKNVYNLKENRGIFGTKMRTIKFAIARWVR